MSENMSKVGNVRLEDGAEDILDRFKQLWLAQEMHICQQLFWLCLEHRDSISISPSTHYIQVTSHGDGIDVLSEQTATQCFMGTNAAFQTILHGALSLIDDMFVIAGGDGLPRQTDENGELLPFDIEQIMSEYKDLIEQLKGGGS